MKSLKPVHFTLSWVTWYDPSFFHRFFRWFFSLFGIRNFSWFCRSLCRRGRSTERISRNGFINLNTSFIYESCLLVILSSPGVFTALEGVAADDFIGDFIDFAGDAPNMLFEGDFNPPGVFGSGAKWPGDFGPGDFGPGVFRPGVLSPGVLWGVLSLRFNWLGLTNAGVGSGLRIVCKYRPHKSWIHWQENTESESFQIGRIFERVCLWQQGLPWSGVPERPQRKMKQYWPRSRTPDLDQIH